MAHNNNRAAKMREREDKALLDIIEGGTLSHAAARAELKARSKEFMAAGVGAKFLQSHQG